MRGVEEGWAGANRRARSRRPGAERGATRSRRGANTFAAAIREPGTASRWRRAVHCRCRASRKPDRGRVPMCHRVSRHGAQAQRHGDRAIPWPRPPAGERRSSRGVRRQTRPQAGTRATPWPRPERAASPDSRPQGTACVSRMASASQCYTIVAVFPQCRSRVPGLPSPWSCLRGRWARPWRPGAGSPLRRWSLGWLWPTAHHPLTAQR